MKRKVRFVVVAFVLVLPLLTEICQDCICGAQGSVGPDDALDGIQTPEEREDAALNIQRTYRSYVGRKEAEQARAAATLIQKIVRGKSGRNIAGERRKLLKWRKEYRQEITVDELTLLTFDSQGTKETVLMSSSKPSDPIDANRRRYFLDPIHMYPSSIEQQRRHDAAIKIQKTYRRHSGKRKVADIKIQRDRAAGQRLQKIFDSGPKNQEVWQKIKSGDELPPPPPNVQTWGATFTGTHNVDDGPPLPPPISTTRLAH